jgi:hypothetical protein
MKIYASKLRALPVTTVETFRSLRKFLILNSRLNRVKTHALRLCASDSVWLRLSPANFFAVEIFFYSLSFPLASFRQPPPDF